MKKRRRNLSLGFREEHWSALECLAHADARSLTNYIEHVVTEHLGSQPSHPLLTSQEKEAQKIQ